MQIDEIQCPQCKNIISNLSPEINKEGGKNYLQDCCPKCGYVFRQRRSWSQGARVLAIVIFIPTAMFLVVVAMTVLRDATFIPRLSYYVVLIVLLVLMLSVHFYFRRKQKNNLRDVLGNEIEKYKYHRQAVSTDGEENIEYKASDDPLMDKIRLDSYSQFKQEKKEKNKKKKSIGGRPYLFKGRLDVKH